MEKKKQNPNIKIPPTLKGLLDNLKTGDESYQSVIQRLVQQVVVTYDDINREAKEGKKDGTTTY